MSKRALIILISVLSVVLVAGIAVTTVVLVIDRNHKNDVAAADRVAADYLDEVATFREEQAEAILESAEVDADAEATIELIAEAADTAPELGSAPEYGRENSDDYAKAADAQEQLQADLETLTTEVEGSTSIAGFIEAASVALNRSTPQDLLGPGPFASGQPVRDNTIPAMQAVKDTFESAEVPEGFEEAAELTTAALQHVLNNLNEMAASLDGGQSYFFEFAPQYSAAEQALEDASDGAQQAIADLIEAFGAGDDLEAPGSGDDSEDDGESDGGGGDGGPSSDPSAEPTES